MPREPLDLAQPGPADAPETFLPVVGYEKYEVSNYGRVRSHHKGLTKFLKPYIHYGYQFVNLQFRSKQRRRQVHILVLEAFIGPKPEDKDLCAHWDDDRTNNRLDNLRWATRAENAADAVRNNRFERGINKKNAVLTDDLAVAIYERLQAGASISDVAFEFRCNSGTVCKIKYGHNWSHATGAERVAIPTRLISRDILLSAADLWRSGASLRVAAISAGISKTGLSKFIERCGGRPSDRNSLGHADD